MVALEIIAALVILALVFGPSLYRRRQANRAADAIGARAGYSAAPPEPASGVGVPNPAVPPPAVVPDQRVASSGPPVRLTICGLPAVVWQRNETLPDSYEGMRLSLIADAGVGLPVLNLFHADGLLRQFSAAHAPSGVDARLDERYKLSGELDAWRAVLASPQVVAGLLAFPLESLSVLGGRITLVSQEGVPLDPSATQALAGVAAALIAAIPAQLAVPSAAPAGTNPTDPEAIVAGVLAKQQLTPEQQQAMLALIRANTRGR